MAAVISEREAMYVASVAPRMESQVLPTKADLTPAVQYPMEEELRSLLAETIAKISVSSAADDTVARV